MKAATALCALSMSAWALAAPVVTSYEHTPPSYSGPQITSEDTWVIHDDRTKLLPAEDAKPQDVLEGRPNNQPYSPSSDVAPSEALAAPRPLKTSYLLSLRPYVVHSEKTEHVSRPDFEESSTVREETGSVTKTHPTIMELETEGNKPFYHRIPCAKSGHFYLARRYADMTVVSIVFVLIAVIAVIELWDSICRTTSRIWHREGRIRLGDNADEKAQLKRQYPDFALQPVPKARSGSPSTAPFSSKAEDVLC